MRGFTKSCVLFIALAGTWLPFTIVCDVPAFDEFGYAVDEFVDEVVYVDWYGDHRHDRYWRCCDEDALFLDLGFDFGF